MSDAHGRDQSALLRWRWMRRDISLACASRPGEIGRLPVNLRARIDLLLCQLLAGVDKTPVIYCEVRGGVHQHRPGGSLSSVPAA